MIEAFIGGALIGLVIGILCGAWLVKDELNIGLGE